MEYAPPQPNLVNQAMILAAGRGVRFRPVTDTIPKPLVEVCGKALIDWQLDMLEMNGITNIVVNACYLKDILIEHISKRKSIADIVIVEEDTALETGGGIKNALHHFGDDYFYTVNSDVILAPQHENMLSQLSRVIAVKPDIKAALLLHYKTHAVGLSTSAAGDFFCDTFGALQRRASHKQAPFYYTGVQLIHPSAFEGIEDTLFSMNKIYDRLLSQSEGNVTDHIVGIINQGGAMLHVGDPEGHAAVEKFLVTTREFQESP